MIRTMIFLTFLTVGGTVFAQETAPLPEKYPVDIKFQVCLDSTENQTTSGMIGCSVRAEAAWDSEMNRYYNLLIKTLTGKEKYMLQAAQKAWLEYRDKEFVFIETAYYNMDVAMHSVVAAGNRVEIVKKRAVELMTYYNVFKMSKQE